MKVVKSIPQMKRFIASVKSQNKKVGFVPTMGALHEGHVSLIRKSVRACDVTVLSIYVNPTQFGPGEDLNSYPRRFKQDKALAQHEGVDVIFYPSNEVMYPEGYNTYVDVEQLTEGLCGAKRPGHFRGVTTIVAKLLNVVSPDVMYVGQKDLQQAVVLQRMVIDLNMDARVQICPTVREASGLAMSSRNQYLSDQQREQAAVLCEALSMAKKKVIDGEQSVARLKKSIKQLIEKKSSSRIEYIEIGDMNTMSSVKRIDQDVFIALAVQLGRARLIDNVIVRLHAKSKKKS